MSQEKDKTRSIAIMSLIASSVHDMKNSLSMLINTLDDVTDSIRPKDADAADRLGQLVYETKRMNNHLVQMLTLYKIGNEQYLLNIAEVDVEDFIDDVVVPHRELLAQRGVKIDIVIEPGLTWYFDKNLVSGVVHNILNNAYKYTRDRIEIGAIIEDGWLKLTIADNGKGYPEEMLKPDAFLQTGISFDTGSTGLGLYFAHQAATMHSHNQRDGFIRFENSGIDGGGRFILALP